MTHNNACNRGGRIEKEGEVAVVAKIPVVGKAKAIAFTRRAEFEGVGLHNHAKHQKPIEIACQRPGSFAPVSYRICRSALAR